MTDSLPTRNPPRLEVHRASAPTAGSTSGRRAVQRLRTRSRACQHPAHEPRRQRSSRCSPAASATASASTGTRRHGSCGSPTTAATCSATTCRATSSTASRKPGLHFGFPYCHSGRRRPIPSSARSAACTEFDAAGAEAGRARRGARHALLHRHACSPPAYRNADLHRRARLVEPQPTDRLPRDAWRRTTAPAVAAYEPFVEGSARGRRPAAARRPGPAGRRAGAARRLAADQRRQRRRDLSRLPRAGDLSAEQVSRASATVPAHRGRQSLSSLKERLSALPVARLKGLRRGIEKESLRAQASGALALTPHPRGARFGADAPEHHHRLQRSRRSSSITGAHAGASRGPVEELDADPPVRLPCASATRCCGCASMPCGLPTDETIPIGRYGSSNVGPRQERLPHGPGPPLRPAHADDLGHPLQLVAARRLERRVFRADPQLPPPRVPAAVPVRRLAGRLFELRRRPPARAAGARPRTPCTCRMARRCAWGGWATRATRRPRSRSATTASTAMPPRCRTR